MQRKATVAAFAGLLALSACGETVGEQAIIGAAAGVGTALLIDGNIGAGALLGAGVNLLVCSQSGTC
jgi:hypothetical protein